MADTKPANLPAKVPSFPEKAPETADLHPMRKPVTLTADDLRRMITEAEEESQESAEKIELQIFEAMLRADTIEDLLTPSEVLKWGDYLEVSVNALNVKFNESTFEDGPAIYAIVDAQLDGKRVLLSCGARTPMAQLMVMREKEMFPAWIKLQQSPRPTKSGKYPLNLAVGDTPEIPFE